MNPPKACLFDLDGLLLDTEPLHGQTWSEVAAFFGGNLTQKQLLFLRGRRRVDCAYQIKEWLEKPLEIKELLAIHQPISKRLLSQAKAMPGAESLVRWCFEQEKPMALVTSSSSESLGIKSAPHPWLKMIKTKVTGDDSALKKGKPAPDPFLLASKKLGLNPQFCWALEDSESGTQSALAAGCQVWVLHNDDESFDWKISPKGSNPCHIKNLTTALEQLKKFNQGE